MQWFTTCISTMLVLILWGMVAFFILFARRLSNSVKENLTVTVLISDEAPASDVTAFRKTLSTECFVNEMEFVSKEQALREQVKAMGSDPSELLGANPFTASLELKMNAQYANSDSLVWITSRLKREACVEEVIYQKDLVDTINENLRRAGYILLSIAGLLALVSLALINNTVRLSIYAGRFVIRTMKLVGASWGFIRRPFMVRSFWLGLTSGLLADAFLLGVWRAVWQYDASLSEYVDGKMMAYVGGSVLVFGLMLTLCCTYLSVNKYLRRKASELY